MEKEWLLQKRIAVLMGGKSGERQVSLRSGARVMAALQRLGADAIGVDPIEGDWVDSMQAASIDIAFLALHGKGCEDGTIQGVLEAFEFAYTGSGVLASALAMNKVMTKRILSTMDIPTPDYLAIDPDQSLDLQCEEAADRLGFPLMLKPASEGSSIGVSIVRELPELKRMARKTQHQFGELFFERYIQGQEVTVGLLGIEKDLRALPVLELIPKREFYDYEAKYTEGMTEFILPARLPDALTNQVQEIAVNTHKGIGCWGVSRVDMRVDTDGQPYVMELNTLPGLTDLSDLPAQAAAAGITYDELIYEILVSAQARG
ncbi:MAG: D-alanine--D-alanine ligase [Candidatus Poribacteria bacterium]|nr:D-alanine--D-alanine ligase [Candidatus Poribacteria bacterium]